jgi:hypothetical protein
LAGKPPTCLQFNLPDDKVTVDADWNGAAAFFDVTLSEVPSGFDVTNMLYPGWCADYPEPNLPDSGFLYSSTDPDIPKKFQDDEQWDHINYILNNKGAATIYEIQVAIWYFADATWPFTTGDVPGADALIADALANGSGFCPDEGDLGAVLISPTNFFPGNNWATWLCYELGTGPMVADLFGGQTIDVGSVTIEEVAGDLVVTYETTGGWLIEETHLHIGDGDDCAEAFGDIPQTKTGNPKIGHFDYASSHDPTVTSVIHTIPLASLDGDFLAIAAHAVVKLPLGEDLFQEETAWGDYDYQLIFIEVEMPER